MDACGLFRAASGSADCRRPSCETLLRRAPVPLAYGLNMRIGHPAARVAETTVQFAQFRDSHSRKITRFIRNGASCCDLEAIQASSGGALAASGKGYEKGWLDVGKGHEPGPMPVFGTLACERL